jgi:hypothetical protein
MCGDAPLITVAHLSLAGNYEYVWFTANTCHTKNLASPQNMVVVWSEALKLPRQSLPQPARVIFVYFFFSIKDALLLLVSNYIQPLHNQDAQSRLCVF